MKMLSTEIQKLLDKLYNLRGEDSVILQKMEDERVKAEETKERTSVETKELQEKINTLTEEENKLNAEGERLVSALRNIKSDDFKFVLDKLNISFDPSSLSDEVSSMLPNKINSIKEDITSSKDSLVRVESEMNDAVAKIEELGIRKDEALSNQARLNEYFDLALAGNINITRESITSLLDKFDISEEEQREAAKLLMFPEDGLFDYEESLKNQVESGKSIIDVFHEAKENIEETSYEMKLPEERKVEEVPIHEEVYEEEIEKSPKEKLIDLLDEYDIDYLEFTSNDLDKVLNNYDEEVIRGNIEFINDNEIDMDFFTNNVELLYDKELREKISKLLAVGKDAFDIYLCPNILFKYNAMGLESVINQLKVAGFDPKKVPLLAY